MNEKIYKTMSRTGACSIAVGIITLVTGVAAYRYYRRCFDDRQWKQTAEKKV